MLSECAGSLCSCERRTFGISLPIEHVRRVLIAIHLDNQPLSAEHGGPFRFVVPDGGCFMRIRWLDHLELCIWLGLNTAERIALGRLAAQEALHKQ